MARPSKAKEAPQSEQGTDKERLFDNNKTLPVSLLRLLTPAGVLAMLPFVWAAAGTLNDLETEIQNNCQTNYQNRLSLWKEHRHDKYSGLFPKPPNPRCYK